MFQILDVDSLRPVRRQRFGPDFVVRALYERIGLHPSRDFVIVDEAGTRVPASRLRWVR